MSKLKALDKTLLAIGVDVGVDVVVVERDVSLNCGKGGEMGRVELEFDAIDDVPAVNGVGTCFSCVIKRDAGVAVTNVVDGFAESALMIGMSLILGDEDNDAERELGVA